MPKGRALIEEIDGLQVAPGAVAFWWLGQLSYIVKVGGSVLYLDPFLAPLERRLVPPLLAPREVTNADWVLGSHDHGDHIDPFTIRGIAAASPRARFVTSRVARRHILEIGVPPERAIGLDEGLLLRARDGDWAVVPVPPDPAALEAGSGELLIVPIAAEHEFFDRDPELGHPYLGYVVRAPGVSLYHAGDTTRYDGMTAKLARFPLDVAFLPINGRDGERYARHCIGNMTFQEAVDLAGSLRPRLAVPGHYDMFEGNTADPQLFVDYYTRKYPGLGYWVGGHGEAVLLPPREAK